jgi:hypothetical protein
VGGKKLSGFLGMMVGGAWLLANFKHFEAQGFVAIGMPLVILILGGIFFLKSD